MRLFLASVFTLSIIFSFVFSLIVLLLLYTDSLNIQFAILLTIAINFTLWLIGPKITDFMNRWLYKMQFIDREELAQKCPEAAKIISEVTTKYNFPFPKIGIIPDQNPTAFTYGSARFNARLVLTEGIFHFLSPQEVKAVVAHELGHIVNRDFIVMMIASTLIQILYEIYSVLIRAKGKKSGNAKSLALLAYIFYIIGIYLLLFLSRTREYLADEFSAKLTSPQDLANALIKIAYGIVTVEDSDSTKRLLGSTRHLGIVDVKNAKYLGVTAYITNSDPQKIAETMVFDKVNPWAKIIELNSTHPLTGNRIDYLSKLSKIYGKPFTIDVDAAIARLQVNMSKLWTDFFAGLMINFAPFIIPLFIVILNLPLALIPLGIGLGLLCRLVYFYPFGPAIQTTILDQMRDPYASPIHGKPVLLSGRVIGRGIPGYVFSEDMMYQDTTGLTFMDYNSILSFIGNFFFAITKIKTLINSPSKAEGWFFRSMGSSIKLKYIQTDQEKIISHPILWSLLLPVILIVVSLFLLTTK